MSQRMTGDLELTEEVVFEVIALNPDKPAEVLRKRYNLSPGRMSEVVDSLLDKGFVEFVEEDEGSDLVWRVTEVGRLLLLKYIQVARFEVMEAQLRGLPRTEVEKARSKKKALETAYKQCKVLFDDE